MHEPKPLKIRRLLEQRLLNYVLRNPGLTASQYGRLLNKPYGTISATLYRLSTGDKSKLWRYEEQGETNDIKKSWRYYYWPHR